VQGSFGFFHHLSHSLKEGAGYLIVALAFWQLRRIGEGRYAVLWFFPFLWYLYLSQATQVYSRYVLPMLPYLCMFAAATAAEWADWVRRYRFSWERPVWVLLCFLLIVPNVFKSLALDILLMRKDVRIEAKDWIESHIPPGSKIAVDHTFFGPPLENTRERLEEWLREVDRRGGPELPKKRLGFMLQNALHPGYELYYLRESEDGGERSFFTMPAAPYDWPTLEKMRMDYLIVIYDDSRDFPFGLSSFYRELEEKSERVARFSPFRSEKWIRPVGPEGMTGAPLYTSEILARRTNGYTIDIYRVLK
ncbi:MAG: hypothetical protein HY391_03075, partial [Deltaproteobacteria bacterium]|nr:hypothetical protein [Deltaproteobacteria bacterium]